MKIRLKNLVLYALCFASVGSARAQGIFQNFDFESANVAAAQAEGPAPAMFVPVGTSLPGWTVYLGTNQQTQVGYNSPTLSTANISLIGPTWNSSDTSRYGNIGIIDGKYSIVVQSGNDPNNLGIDDNASILQNGTVPPTAQSLQFDAYAFGPFSVSFGGNSLNPVALSSGVSADGVPYTVYGADISAWAGHTGALEFTADYNASDPFVVLDDITFSTEAVPEPGTVSFLIMGGIALVARRRRAKGL